MQKKSAVIHFIDEERAKGSSDKEIQHSLLDAGWQMDIIQHAMNDKHRIENLNPIKSAKIKKSQVINQQVILNFISQPIFLVGVFIAILLLVLFI